ncbi:hypothetical protein FA95DRAFT_108522 [Auriscalpium vulgare]|uniref:Uncharacterized protein n=1 Tax=Auriscalpium vulgare TaxID=40419 RepID=A0ACB8S768_9AGAM|nr:hypothetical protein FA95DRAFT_108522 [Auriscalpium vulgare]
MAWSELMAFPSAQWHTPQCRTCIVIYKVNGLSTDSQTAHPSKPLQRFNTMSLPAAVLLNNYMQDQPGGLASLSWEAKEDRTSVNRWTITCKIGGEAKATVSSPHKAAAKEEAARLTMVALGIA